MISSTRVRWMGLSLVVSLLMNVATLGYLARSGGLRRIFLRMDLLTLHNERLPFQKDLEAKYRKLPNTASEIVFAGDSLMADGPWSEFYSDIRQRGIGGDMVRDMLDRIDEIIESHPKKIFLQLGTNDLSQAVPPTQFLRNYRELLGRIRKDSNETSIYVIAIFPHRNDVPIPEVFDNAKVAEINGRLKELAAEFPRTTYVDLTSVLADQAGNLRKEYSLDGTHLNVDGFLAIREHLGRFVFDSGQSKVAAEPK